ncbi:MAG TPA: hypothetical protein VNF68_00925 [Candidatus Baltobacteraceae bacterium]|nr:hypothetical protein [Candidatus Baltobacteraceae bacterium]
MRLGFLASHKDDMVTPNSLAGGGALQLGETYISIPLDKGYNDAYTADITRDVPTGNPGASVHENTHITVRKCSVAASADVC